MKEIVTHQHQLGYWERRRGRNGWEENFVDLANFSFTFHQHVILPQSDANPLPKYIQDDYASGFTVTVTQQAGDDVFEG